MQRRTAAAGSLAAIFLVAACQSDPSPEAGPTTSPTDTSSSTASPSSPEAEPALPRYVARSVDVPASAAEIVAGFGSLWVQSHRAHTITRLDAGSGRVVAEVAASGSNLISLVAGAGHLWYLDSPTGRIEGIDPERNKVTVDLTIRGEEGGGFVGTRDEVWFAGTSRHLYRIDPDGRITATVPLRSSGSPLWPVLVGEKVWVSDPGAGRVYVVDRNSLEVERRLRLDGDVFISAAGFGSVWIGALSGPLFRLDPATGDVQATIDLPSADHVVACSRRVWVRTTDREVVGIDPATNEVVESYDDLPHSEIPGGGILCQEDSLWVVNWTDASVWKIPTRT